MSLLRHVRINLWSFLKNRRRTVVAAAVLCMTPVVSWANPPPKQVPDTMAQRVQACTACHGKEGRATSQGYLPRIAGKPAAYLYNQLVNFRDGRRTNSAMTYLIENMSDAYLLEIAGYFAALDLPYPPPQLQLTSMEELARGERLVSRGDAKTRIPACVQCHGAAMTGVLPSIPGLLGLPRDYLLGQLGAWRSDKRKGVTPDCMAQIARRLNLQDVSAIATWLSAQAVPTDSKPAPSVPQPLPIACGSGSK